jgi:hypothetical protein
MRVASQAALAVGRDLEMLLCTEGRRCTHSDPKKSMVPGLH